MVFSILLSRNRTIRLQMLVVLFTLVVLYLFFFQARYSIFFTQVDDRPDKIVKQRFDEIYEKNVWNRGGDGSGIGSSIQQTRDAHRIILEVIDEYKIESMIDAPCGSFLWMSRVMQDVANNRRNDGRRFRYHGIDVVESVIERVKVKYSNMSNGDDWQFSVCDFTAQKMPPNYELVFSRDALMHLSYSKVNHFFFLTIIYLKEKLKQLKSIIRNRFY